MQSDQILIALPENSDISLGMRRVVLTNNPQESSDQ